MQIVSIHLRHEIQFYRTGVAPQYHEKSIKVALARDIKVNGFSTMVKHPAKDVGCRSDIKKRYIISTRNTVGIITPIMAKDSSKVDRGFRTCSPTI